MNPFGLIVLGIIYPNSDRLAKTVRVKVIAFIRLRTINAVDVNRVFVNFGVVRPARIPLRGPKPNVDFSRVVFAPVLYLYSFELLFLSSNQVKGSMLGQGIGNDKSLLVKVHHRFEDSQVSGGLCMVIIVHRLASLDGEQAVSSVLAVKRLPI